jgi:hypothetical protein
MVLLNVYHSTKRPKAHLAIRQVTAILFGNLSPDTHRKTPDVSVSISLWIITGEGQKGFRIEYLRGWGDWLAQHLNSWIPYHAHKLGDRFADQPAVALRACARIRVLGRREITGTRRSALASLPSYAPHTTYELKATAWTCSIHQHMSH